MLQRNLQCLWVISIRIDFLRSWESPTGTSMVIENDDSLYTDRSSVVGGEIILSYVALREPPGCVEHCCSLRMSMQ